MSELSENEAVVNLAIASPTKVNSSTIAQLSQERCPASIEFGQFDIETWYSSPYPQEYAR